MTAAINTTGAGKRGYPTKSSIPSTQASTQRRARERSVAIQTLLLVRKSKSSSVKSHRNFTRRQVAIQNRVASNIGISQSTFSVKVLNLFSRSRRKTNKRKSKHSAMLRNKETRHRMFIGLLNTTRKLA